MGWLSSIAKIGGWAAAPFTGGVSALAGNAIGNALDAGGAGAGGAANAMANNRGTKLGVMMDQNDALERQLLAREQEKRLARNDAYKNAIRGSIAYNYDPSKQFAGAPANMPHFDVTGGTMGNPQAHAAGDEMLKQSMNRLTQPDLQTNGGYGMTPYRNLATDPEFSKAMNPSRWEKILGGASAISPILGALAKGTNQANAGGSKGMGNLDPGVF